MLRSLLRRIALRIKIATWPGLVLEDCHHSGDGTRTAIIIAPGARDRFLCVGGSFDNWETAVAWSEVKCKTWSGGENYIRISTSQRTRLKGVVFKGVTLVVVP